MSDAPNILVVCDIQKDFLTFIKESLLEELKTLLSDRKWDQIIVIVDTNMGEALIPDWLDDSSTTIITKSYGYVYGEEDMQTLGEFKAQEDGTYLEVYSDNLYLPVAGVHNWFAVTEEFRNFFKGLQGQEVSLVGGARDECLQDVNDALEYLGVKPSIMDAYCYDVNDRHELPEWDEYEIDWVKAY